MNKSRNAEFYFKGVCWLLWLAAMAYMLTRMILGILNAAEDYLALLPFVLTSMLLFVRDWLWERIPDEVDILRLRRDRAGLMAALLEGREGKKAGRALVAIGAAEDADRLYQVLRSLEDKASISPGEASHAGVLIEALQGFRAENALGYLHSLLASRHAPLRAEAAGALGRRGDRRSAEALLAALDDSSRDVVGAAARALGQLGERRAIQPIIDLLENHPERIDRLWAVEGLERFSDPNAQKCAARQRAVLEADKKAFERRSSQPAPDQAGQGALERQRLAQKRCWRCGTQLSRLEMARPAGITLGSLPTLYDGVVCTACGKLECTRCKGAPVERPCAWCGGAVSPAYETMLVEMQDRLQQEAP